MPFAGNHPSMYNSEPLPEPGPMIPPPPPPPPPPQTMPMYGNQGMNMPFNQSSAQGHGQNHQRDGNTTPGPPFLQAAEEKTHSLPLNSYQHSQNAPGYYDNYYSQQAVHHLPPTNLSECELHLFYFLTCIKVSSHLIRSISLRGSAFFLFYMYSLLQNLFLLGFGLEHTLNFHISLALSPTVQYVVL